MTCILCHSWNQTDPNCGHYLLNGVHMPSRSASAVPRDIEVLGGFRAFAHASHENARSEAARLEHITRQTTYGCSHTYVRRTA